MACEKESEETPPLPNSAIVAYGSSASPASLLRATGIYYWLKGRQDLPNKAVVARHRNHLNPGLILIMNPNQPRIRIQMIPSMPAVAAY